MEASTDPRQARLDRYRELVFSPLALPGPPELETNRLIEWMTRGAEECRSVGRNRPESAYQTLTGRQYPWLMATVSLDGTEEIDRSFGRDFPDLAGYVAQFPLRGRPVLVLLAQREQTAVYLHTDLDRYWGFRFYLARRRDDALYFCMARARVDRLPRIAPRLTPFVDETRRYYASWPPEERAYCVNSIRAAHAVEASACRLGERIACLVQSRDGIDEERLLPLLEESSARFAPYQIWYQTPRG